MVHILTQWGFQIAYAIVLAFILFIFKSLYKKILVDHESWKVKQHAMMMGIQSILYYRICAEGDRILQRGYITKQEVRDLEYFYTSYKNLDGNGVAKKIYTECINLPMEGEEINGV